MCPDEALGKFPPPSTTSNKYILQTFLANSWNSCFARNLNRFGFCSLKKQFSYRSYFPVGSGSTETLQTNQQKPSSILSSLAEVSTCMQTLDTGLAEEMPSRLTCFWSPSLVRGPVTPQSSLGVNFTADLKLVGCMRLQTIKTASFTV